MRPYLLCAVLLGATLLGGCLGAPGRAEPTPTKAPLYDVGNDLSVGYNSTECQEGFVARLITFEQAAKSLPPGFKAKDAEGLLGLPIARGKAAAYFGTARCTRSELAVGGSDDGIYGIFIEAPNVAGERPVAATVFYEVGRITSREETLVLFKALGWNVHEGVVDVAISQTVGNVANTGNGIARNDEGIIQFTYGMTAPQDARLAGLARFWHKTSLGLGYVDYTLDTPVRQGSASCDLKANSEVNKLVGASTCPPGEAFSIVLNNFAWTARVHHLVNATAT